MMKNKKPSLILPLFTALTGLTIDDLIEAEDEYELVIKMADKQKEKEKEKENV